MCMSAMLMDLTVNGEARKAVVTTGKLGIIEAIDRTNGQWLWHKETVPQNVVASIDPKTGAKTINPASIPAIGQTTVNCPADPGSRGWPATAYSPKTGMLYLPLNEYCSNTTPTPLDPGQAYTGGGRAVFARVPVPGSDGKIGRVDAVKMSDQSTVWSYRHACAADRCRVADRRRRRVQRRLGPLVPRLRRHNRPGAVADAPQQCHQCLPGQLYGRRQAVCGDRRRQRVERSTLARNPDTGAQESGWRFGAVGVRAGRLMRVARNEKT